MGEMGKSTNLPKERSCHLAPVNLNAPICSFSDSVNCFLSGITPHIAEDRFFFFLNYQKIWIL